MAEARRLRTVSGQPGRAVLYVRVSATMGRSGADFHSPDLQLDAMRGTTVPAGLREVAVVQDIDTSGRSFSREGLDQIRKMVEAKQVDVIAVYDLSRLGRNVAEALTFIRWLRDRGVRIMSTVEQITDGPEGQFMLTQFLAMAQLYSDQMGRRWSDVLARRARDQGLGHGAPPIGYIKDGRGLAIHPVLGEAVADMIRAYADGESTVNLAKKLGALRGRPVEPTTIRKVCVNPFYVGLVPSRGEWFPGTQPPLVDETVHTKAVARAAADAAMPPRSRVPVHSISGLVWCGECDGRAMMKLSTEKGRVRRVAVLCSAATARYPKGCAGFGSPPLAGVEAEVLAQVRDWVALLRDDPAARSARHAEQSRFRLHREQLQHDLAKEVEAMGRLTSEWARKKIPQAAYEIALAEIGEKEAALRSALSAAALPVRAVSDAELLGLALRLLGKWEAMTGPRRGRALRTIVRRVVLHRGDGRGRQRVEVEFV